MSCAQFGVLDYCRQYCNQNRRLKSTTSLLYSVACERFKLTQITKYIIAFFSDNRVNFRTFQAHLLPSDRLGISNCQIS